MVPDNLREWVRYYVEEYFPALKMHRQKQKELNRDA